MSKYNIEFKKLTPRDNIDMGAMEEALDYVFKEDDINNIAIAGAYGSGKSSLIETYKKTDKKNKYLTISLAHFEDSNDQMKENMESVLERKIINQLVHKVPAKSIPLTNFKLKSNPSKFSLIAYCCAIVFIVITLLHILLFDKWLLYYSSIDVLWIKKAFELTVQQWSPIISSIIAIIIFSIIIYKIIKLEVNHNILKKLKLKDAEIELYNDDDNASYFDKYLNDILYIFDNCEENAFVFEDLDRFDSVIITAPVIYILCNTLL